VRKLKNKGTSHIVAQYLGPDQLEKGDIIRLYNYYCGFDEYTRRAPEITGMLIRIGREAQFEFYEIAVMRDESGRGGYVERYLTSDFFVMKLTPQKEGK
tara:strand:+ start:176 stop:472 length:297 start_codon:yes stop_codon:yes gene_type:complete